MNWQLIKDWILAHWSVLLSFAAGVAVGGWLF